MKKHVCTTTFFCLDEERNIFVGAASIRHTLNEGLLATGGHIGDGVRPSERRKGVATAMIGLALEECRKLGIEKVLICCDKNNKRLQEFLPSHPSLQTQQQSVLLRGIFKGGPLKHADKGSGSGKSTNRQKK